LPKQKILKKKPPKSVKPVPVAKQGKRSKTLLESALFRGKKAKLFPVILAGGSGTRFWPHSRRATPKQVLALDGSKTMIQQTVERLAALAPPEQFWVITNELVAPVIRKQLPKLKKEQILAEPAARNTAPAIGLAAFILVRKYPDAVLGLFPADHVIKADDKFREDVSKGIELAASGEKIVVMGVLPQRPETGYGYIEAGAPLVAGLFRVKRFTEKPNAEKAREFIAEGNYYWNSGMFLWSARTLVNALHAHLPETAKVLEQIAATHGNAKFATTFKRLYPKCQNISIDYAVLEPRSAYGEVGSGIYCIATDFGWNDLGSWAALYDHRALGVDANVIEAQGSYVENAALNYISSPKRFVAAIGVRNLVVVETDDALLITTRQHSQDVGKVPKYLSEKGMKKLI
jgi:mannose-1-phosphate guanylyltransferase